MSQRLLVNLEKLRNTVNSLVSIQTSKSPLKDFPYNVKGYVTIFCEKLYAKIKDMTMEYKGETLRLIRSPKEWDIGFIPEIEEVLPNGRLHKGGWRNRLEIFLGVLYMGDFYIAKEMLENINMPWFCKIFPKKSLMRDEVRDLIMYNILESLNDLANEELLKLESIYLKHAKLGKGQRKGN